MILPPTSEISHHHKVTNITKAPTSLSSWNNLDFEKNKWLDWEFILIESDDRIEIPRSKLFRTNRDKVWIQPIHFSRLAWTWTWTNELLMWVPRWTISRSISRHSHTLQCRLLFIIPNWFKPILCSTFVVTGFTSLPSLHIEQSVWQSFCPYVRKNY